MIAEKIKEHSNKIFMFVINILVVAVVALVIKNQDKNRLEIQTNFVAELTPIDSDILQAQGEISAYRENKLREFNNSPKDIQQQNTTTTVTTTTPTTVKTTQPSSSSTSTKTS